MARQRLDTGEQTTKQPKHTKEDHQTWDSEAEEDKSGRQTAHANPPTLSLYFVCFVSFVVRSRVFLSPLHCGVITDGLVPCHRHFLEWMPTWKRPIYGPTWITS